MNHSIITDLSIPASSLQPEQQALRKLYLISAEKIWQVDVHASNAADSSDPVEQSVGRLFRQWASWFTSNDFSLGIRVERVKLLTEAIKETHYACSPHDTRLSGIWQRQLQTIQTQVSKAQVTETTLSSMRRAAQTPLQDATPRIIYDQGQKEYTGGVLPRGLLTPAPYSANPTQHAANQKLEDDSATIWRQMRFMELWVDLDCSEKETAQQAEQRQETTQRFVEGETAMWNELIQHYSGYIGDAPKDITNKVDHRGFFSENSMRVYVAAHRLESGAEILSVAILPQEAAESTPVTIEIPTRWGAPQITAPEDVFRFLEGTAKAKQAVVICARRLQLNQRPEDYRPEHAEYRQTVNPQHQAYQIYDNLIWGDSDGVCEEVLPYYSKHCATRLEPNLIWGSAMGANRVLADMVKDSKRRTPVVLMAPFGGLLPTNAHWSYLAPYSGIDVDYKGEIVDKLRNELDLHTTQGCCTLGAEPLRQVNSALTQLEAYSPYTKKDVFEATCALALAKKLPEGNGRKVLVLGAPASPVYPKAGCLHGESMQEFVTLLSAKGYAVTQLDPDYALQEWPVPGIRIYPDLSTGAAAQWLAELN